MAAQSNSWFVSVDDSESEHHDRRPPRWMIITAAAVSALLALPLTYFVAEQFGSGSQDTASAQPLPSTTTTSTPQLTPIAPTRSKAITSSTPKTVAPAAPARSIGTSPERPVLVSAATAPSTTSSGDTLATSAAPTTTASTSPATTASTSPTSSTTTTTTTAPPITPEVLPPSARAAVASLGSGLGGVMLRVQIDQSVAPGDAVSYHVVCVETAPASAEYTWIEMYARWVQDLLPVSALSSRFEATTSSRDIVFQNAFPYPGATYHCDVTPTFNGTTGASIGGDAAMLPTDGQALPHDVPAPKITAIAQTTGMIAKASLESADGNPIGEGNGLVKCEAGNGVPAVYGLNEGGALGWGMGPFRIGATYTCRAVVPGSFASEPFTFTPTNVDNVVGVPGAIPTASIPMTGSGTVVVSTAQPTGRTNAEEYAVTARCTHAVTGAAVRRTRIVQTGELADPATARVFAVDVLDAGDYRCRVVASNGLGDGPTLDLPTVHVNVRPTAASNVQVLSAAGTAAQLSFRPSTSGSELSLLGYVALCDSATNAQILDAVQVQADGSVHATLPNLAPGATHRCTIVSVYLPLAYLVGSAAHGGAPFDLNESTAGPTLLDLAVTGDYSLPLDVTMPAI